MKNLILATATAVLVGATTQAAVFDFFGGQMDGVEAMSGSGGIGQTFDPGIIYNETTRELTFNFEYFGLESSFQSTELREGAPGTVGTLITPLNTDQTGPTTGFVAPAPTSPNNPQPPVTLTEDQAAQLFLGNLFVVINTVDSTPEIRGQLTPVPEPAAYATFGGLALLGFAGYRRVRKAKDLKLA